ncbi:MAG: hypothetical protein IJN25_08545 [Clostridia bacterium]|nr:hypothetical protein [Clostridia bacterium]
MLSDGTFETESFWSAEEDGMLVFCNGGDSPQPFTMEAQSGSYCLLYGAVNPVITEGLLSIEMPPHSLLILAENDGTRRGFLKDGILHLSPMEGGTVQCEEDAIMAQYLFYDGKPELTGIYRNGDILLDGEGEVRFFRWDKMQPLK